MKKENETLTLISKNEDQAILAIENLKLKARETSGLVKYFNDIALLSEIKTEVQVLEFLKGPVNYFRKRILFDIKFSSKVQPPAEGIAELYKIPYKEITQRLGSCQVTDLLNMLFDETNQVIEFDEKARTKIMKSFYSYAANKKESEAIIEARELCELLNKHCERWDVDMSSMNTVAHNLGLKMESLPGAKQGDRRTGEFKEHITVIRSKLEYEKTWG